MLRSVLYLVLEVAHNSALRHFSDREHIADDELSLLTAIDKLTSVHALSSDKQLLLQSVLVNIPELNNSKGSSTTGIVDDLLDHALHIAVALGKVQGTEPSSTLPVLGVGLEDRTTTSTASTNNTTLHKDDIVHIKYSHSISTKYQNVSQESESVFTVLLSMFIRVHEPMHSIDESTHHASC